MPDTKTTPEPRQNLAESDHAPQTSAPAAASLVSEARLLGEMHRDLDERPVSRAALARLLGASGDTDPIVAAYRAAYGGWGETPGAIDRRNIELTAGRAVRALEAA